MHRIMVILTPIENESGSLPQRRARVSKLNFATKVAQAKIMTR
jgi:hypothetical protein